MSKAIHAVTGTGIKNIQKIYLASGGKAKSISKVYAVVDGTAKQVFPDTPNENIPEGFCGDTIDIYLDATSSNKEGGTTKETAIGPYSSIVNELANKAQNVNIHIVKVALNNGHISAFRP